MRYRNPIIGAEIERLFEAAFDNSRTVAFFDIIDSGTDESKSRNGETENFNGNVGQRERQVNYSQVFFCKQFSIFYVRLYVNIFVFMLLHYSKCSTTDSKKFTVILFHHSLPTIPVR